MIKLNKNEWWIIVSLIPQFLQLNLPIPTITEITGSIQSSAGKYLSSIDLVTIFHSVPTSVTSQPVYLATPMISTTPTTHTIFVSNHIQLSPGSWEWHYVDDIFFEEIHWTHWKHTNKIDKAAPRKGWPITLPIVQGPTISVKFLGITWSVKYCSILDTVKKQRLTLAEPTTFKQAQHHLGLF